MSYHLLGYINDSFIVFQRTRVYMQHNIFNDQYFSTENASCIENHNVSPSSDICSAVQFLRQLYFIMN